MMRWTLGGREQFFDASGEATQKGLMRTPVDGARLTSGFGMRLHPLLGYSRMHKGVDFGAPHGAPILAAAAGRIEFAGSNRGYGKYVKIRHGNGKIGKAQVMTPVTKSHLVCRLILAKKQIY